MGVCASVGGAVMQAEAAKKQARKMMQAQEAACRAAHDPYGLGSGLFGAPHIRKASGAPERGKVIKCQNCGSNHWEGHACEYCGPPSIPRVRRKP